MAIRSRKTALNRFKRHPSDENFIDFKKKRAMAKRVIKEEKTRSWQSFTSSFNDSISSGDMWKNIRKMKGFPPKIIPGLLINDQWLSDPKAIGNSLAEHLRDRSSSTAPVLSLPPNFLPENILPYNLPFSLKELRSSLSSAKNSAPGPDGIHLEMILNLPPSILELILEYFNHLWTSNEFPQSWLQSIVIPIHKMGKPRNSPNSYRPISLTNILTKIMERMVKNRLEWFLETHHLLSPFQYGFRKNTSPLDHLASLDTDIRSSFQVKNHLLAVSLDLQNAFDLTNTSLVLNQLKKLNFKGNLPKFISNFIQPRSFRVKVNGALSDTYTMVTGIPQGSILSPILFLIAIQSLDEFIPPNIKAKYFADDIILYLSSNDSNYLSRTMQRTLSRIEEWASQSGFSFSPSKSASIHFCKGRNCPKTHLLNLTNGPIPSQNNLNILGLKFDSSLNWKYHIDYLREKTSKDLNLMRLLSNTKWGGSFPSLMKIYNSLILSKLNYGSFIYDAAKNSYKNKLDTIQNQALRLATGAFRTSPIPSLQCVSSTPPLSLSRLHSLLKFYAKSAFKPSFRRSLLLNRQISILPPDTIAARIKSFLDTHNLSFQFHESSKFQMYPPWTTAPPCMDLSLLKYDKDLAPDSLIRISFISILKEKYNDFFPIYTDGAKSPSGTGSAVIAENFALKLKLNRVTSVFSAELLGLKEALRWAISSKSSRKYLLITDSLSSLQAISSSKTHYPLVINIIDLLKIGQNRGLSFVFLWVPSHKSIKGNDSADQNAKMAIIDGIPTKLIYSPRDLASYFNTIIANLFQLDWDLQEGSNKLWEVKPLVNPPLFLPSLSRKENVIWRRVAIGHTYLSHSHLLKGEPQPVCPKCNCPLSIKHILESNDFLDKKLKFNIIGPLSQILKPNHEGIKNLINYLKETIFQNNNF